MATGMKDIKNRITSVENTMQITKAMELVASSKLRKAKDKAEKSKPFFDILYDTMVRIASAKTKQLSSVYVKPRKEKKAGFVIIGGDKGLAGGYNINIFRKAEEKMSGREVCVLPIGKKAYEYFRKKGYPIVKRFENIPEEVEKVQVVDIVDTVIELYKNKEIDELYVIYTEFVSALTQIVRIKKLLPLYLKPRELEEEEYETVQYDPSPTAVFDNIVPLYLEGIFYVAVLESYASEQGARRIAMESATDNAGEMIEQLNLQYNRARQWNITQELSEIVSGAEALK